MLPDTLEVRVQRRLLKSVLALPPAVRDRLFGAPPVNQRGHALDADTHVMLRLERRFSKPFAAGEPDDARRAMRVGVAITAPAPAQVAVTEGRIEGVPVRIYGVDADPTLVYAHGGGFVCGDLDTHDTLCRRLALEGRRRVVSVHYPRAPEQPFPAPLDAVLAVFRAERRRLPGRVELGGDSAGGTLTAAACQLLRDAGEAMPDLQLLIYPSVEWRCTSESHAEFAEGFLLTVETIDWYWGALRGPAGRRAGVADPGGRAGWLASSRARDRGLRSPAGSRRGLRRAAGRGRCARAPHRRPRPDPRFRQHGRSAGGRGAPPGSGQPGPGARGRLAREPPSRVTSRFHPSPPDLRRGHGCRNLPAMGGDPDKGGGSLRRPLTVHVQSDFGLTEGFVVWFADSQLRLFCLQRLDDGVEMHGRVDLALRGDDARADLMFTVEGAKRVSSKVGQGLPAHRDLATRRPRAVAATGRSHRDPGCRPDTGRPGCGRDRAGGCFVAVGVSGSLVGLGHAAEPAQPPGQHVVQGQPGAVRGVPGRAHRSRVLWGGAARRGRQRVGRRCHRALASRPRWQGARLGRQGPLAARGALSARSDRAVRALKRPHRRADRQRRNGRRQPGDSPRNGAAGALVPAPRPAARQAGTEASVMQAAWRVRERARSRDARPGAPPPAERGPRAPDRQCVPIWHDVGSTSRCPSAGDVAACVSYNSEGVSVFMGGADGLCAGEPVVLVPAAAGLRLPAAPRDRARRAAGSGDRRRWGVGASRARVSEALPSGVRPRGESGERAGPRRASEAVLS